MVTTDTIITDNKKIVVKGKGKIETTEYDKHGREIRISRNDGYEENFSYHTPLSKKPYKVVTKYPNGVTETEHYKVL